MLRKLTALCLAALLFTCTHVWGQVTTGTILGSVHDPAGAAVAGATVVITDLSKGTTTQYQTDQAGAYNAPFLIPGTYSVTVSKEGFKRAVTPSVVLDLDQKARVDLTLEIGQVSQTLEVTAAASLVRSESAELGEVVAQRQVQDLPLNGRNFAQLVDLVPGGNFRSAGRESFRVELIQPARYLRFQCPRQSGEHQCMVGGRY